jgi:hypothetical protein
VHVGGAVHCATLRRLASREKIARHAHRLAPVVIVLDLLADRLEPGAEVPGLPATSLSRPPSGVAHSASAVGPFRDISGTLAGRPFMPEFPTSSRAAATDALCQVTRSPHWRAGGMIPGLEA